MQHSNYNKLPIWWRSNKTILFVSTVLIISFSCKKFLETPTPPDQIISKNVFSDNASAEAAVRGIYSEMMNNPRQFTSGYTTFFCGMTSDELYYYSPSSRDEFVTNQITAANHSLLTASFWQPAYKYIYSANLCIESLAKSQGVTSQAKAQLTGEAKFIRAFCYFHLFNIFGNVPLVLSSNYQENASLPRTENTKIVNQIINDLKDAELTLSAEYPTAGKVRPNKYTATALLSKVYLYHKDWTNAELKASEIISTGLYTLEENLNNVFLQSNSEAIWQLYPANANFNTYEGNQILPATSSSAPTYLLTPQLITAFETGDLRKEYWTKSRIIAGQTIWYPFKYKIRGGKSAIPVLECYQVFRLADIYLVRAEARAYLNNYQGALSDLNKIRNRAGLQILSAITQSEILTGVEQERRIELFAEWGNRWYDLKRTGKVYELLSALKPATWNTTDALWPIPFDQIMKNPFLIQNPGY